MLSKKEKDNIVKKRVTFTKKWVSIILIFSCIWITLSYVLAFMGKEYIAESLSSTVAQVIIATMIPYLCKSYFETFAEERNKLKEKELELNTSDEIIDEEELIQEEPE